jgi:hypothetical protein
MKTFFQHLKRTKMNTIFRIFLMAVTVLGMAACSNDAGTKPEAAQTATADGHEHAYSCPMNCEKGKTYNKPGKCPVCGMNLEHNDGGEDNGLAYKMQYSSNPPQLTAGQPAILSFTPKVVGKEADDVALDLQHEKKIHLIVVSDDLSYFEHIHPDYQSDGSYQVKVLGKGQNYTTDAGRNETRFENGGNFVLFADYKPTGGAHQVEKVPLKVGGPEKQSVRFSAAKLSGTSGPYTVTLNPTTGKLFTGAQLHLEAAVQRDGKEINAGSLENYLGAKAHMVVLSLDDKEYLHVHPEVVNGKFDLHTTFKKPGIYRGWIQFQNEGKVHTIDFTMNVVQGTAEDIAKAGKGHEG